MTYGKNGARGGRTLTVLPPTDFKSVASADSAIAPAVLILPYFEILSDSDIGRLLCLKVIH